MSEIIDYGGVKERIQVFDRRHGASVSQDGWFLYEDGAMREYNPLGALRDPPADPWQLAKRQWYFWKLKFDRAVKDYDTRYRFYFENAKANLNAGNNCGPAPATPAEAKTELAILRKAVEEVKRRFDLAAVALDRSKPEFLKANEHVNVINRQANELLLASLEKLKI